MTLDQLINALVTITLIEMMMATGLGVTFVDLAGVARNVRLVARAGLANYVCVPAVTVGLLLLFNPHPMVAAGFLILAVCPGAPYGPPFSAIAKGNLAVAIGLMVMLAGSSAIIAPLLLHYLLPLVSGNESLNVDALTIADTLLATQLLPLGVGVAIRQWYPHLAERMQKPANLASKILNLLAVGVILGTQFELLTEIRPLGFVGMVALLIASGLAGWLLGGPEPGIRKTMTLTTSLRNVGVGLVIATGAFAGTPAVTATLIYGLFEVLGSLLLALGWAQRGAGTNRSAVESDVKDEKDYSAGGKDRAEWDQAWGSMPHRRLLTPPKIDVVGCFSGSGEVVSVTISGDPLEFSNMAWRPSETCPVCGASTVGTERLPASLHPTFANGLSYGLGVWVHPSCFECCPGAGAPTPIPW
jgi:BASS family bile acid:Na+ symporter